MEPLRPIDVRLRREVDRVTPPVRLSPVERDAERERREQARKRREKATAQTPEGGLPDDGHLDLLA
jgi:hypothetical protein